MVIPDENACRDHFKAVRDREGVYCKRCGRGDHWWLKSKAMYECKNCGRRMSLRSGSVMENSKLPFRFWYVAMHLMTASKRNISALEVQKQLGHAYYEPIWAMMHKLRRVMANRDEMHQPSGGVEMNAAFFDVNDPEDPEEPGMDKKKAEVMVIAESSPAMAVRNGRRKRRCGHFKMIAIQKTDAGTGTRNSSRRNAPGSRRHSGKSAQRKGHHNLVKHHDPVHTPNRKRNSIVPWMQRIVGNAQALIRATYHGVSGRYLQNYLSEFSYKLNRRHHEFAIFDRLVVASTHHWNR